MRNAGLEEAQAGIKIAGRNINKEAVIQGNLHCPYKHGHRSGSWTLKDCADLGEATGRRRWRNLNARPRDRSSCC